ncbi:two-component sensor histidine kinase [Lentzea tibetensis]|uniref:Two-component sensor histidine kinase n=1 Tax=Lentzea tibetensis TaxID=2591470 RepID=A0A563ERX8_9PSEU|nr:sensor histidine kinase [Lentzea tibetensis]TWP50410.1 two-component sensor histidine kinase [Lentzea tibetensis]
MAVGRALSSGLGALAVAEVGLAVAFTIGVGWSWQQALNAFVVTNSVIGAAFAACGAIIAWHRPRNPIGWLFVADGLGHATTAMAAPLLQVLHDGGAPVGLQRLVATVFAYSWPWSIGLLLPLALVLFPDGRPPSPRWRPVLLVLVVTAPLFVVELGATPQPLTPGLPTGYLTVDWYDQVAPLWILSEVRTLAALFVGIIAMVVRYRRGDDVLRRQLLWLVLATITTVGFVTPWSLVTGTPIVVLFAIPLIPVAVTIAIIRHRLLDIRLVVSRVVTWLLLSACVVLAYGVLVAVLDRFVSAQLGRSAVATIVVALLVAPVLPRLQRLVDRALYGDRGDPARVVSRVGEQLAGPGLAGVVSAIRTALRVPYVAVHTSDGPLAEDGTAPAEVAVVPLEYGGAPVGELRVGVRPGEGDLGAADRAVLGLVAAPLAVAVHATLLSAQLQTSRERIVAAQEEERRRLRRDLHDGLGPTLTGVALTADAATNLLGTDPARTRSLLAAIRTDVRTAITDVRRLVENLRPPALDELGLLGALRQRAEHLAWRADGAALHVRLDVPDEVPALPAAVEVAAYRIATEALTNVVRHSGASGAVLRLRCTDDLDVEITDDGPLNGPWHPGVGLNTMRERAAELGGRFDAGPSPTGGRVHVSLPLVVP